jgi:lipopolysaccharide/colanic/teichoic acid biosynthesis glycosyltransferase
MRTENGSCATSFIAIDREGPHSSQGLHRLDNGQAFNVRNDAGVHSINHRQTLSQISDTDPGWRDALPLNEFLKDIHREKCRCERSKAPLSIALYQLDDKQSHNPAQADHLLEVLHSAKRETDILGHVGDNMIAVLCPDTDERGIQAFISHIDSQIGELPCEAIAATYPDNLFEQLTNGSYTQPPFQLFLVAETVAKTSGSYPLKRSLDIVGALLGIALFGPLMLLISTAIALSSPGPIIFRQSRLGRGGVPFTFYKFRSMTTNVDDSIHRTFVVSLIKAGQAEAAAADGAPSHYKLQSDPRITRLGRFMRKTSIDELPQFFNVLKGDMSLVGPRPPIAYEAAQYQPWHLRRMLSIQPGITGLWQVEGRSRVSFNEMVRMDLRYIRNCSLGMDLKILLKTVLVVLLCKGAG